MSDSVRLGFRFTSCSPRILVHPSGVHRLGLMPGASVAMFGGRLPTLKSIFRVFKLANRRRTAGAGEPLFQAASRGISVIGPAHAGRYPIARSSRSSWLVLG